MSVAVSGVVSALKCVRLMNEITYPGGFRAFFSEVNKEMKRERGRKGWEKNR